MARLRQFLFFSVFLILISMYSPITLCMEPVKVIACPKNKTLWDRRAANFPCTGGNIIPYHCMRSVNGRFFEFCRQVAVFYSDQGCPVLVTGDSSLNITHMKCVGVTGCPGLGMKPVFSSRLYEYPACLSDTYMSATAKVTDETSLQSKESTAPWHLTTGFMSSPAIPWFGNIQSRADKNGQNVDEEEKTSSLTSRGVTAGVAGTVTVLFGIGAVVLVLFIQRRRRKRKDNDSNESDLQGREHTMESYDDVRGIGYTARIATRPISVRTSSEGGNDVTNYTTDDSVFGSRELNQDDERENGGVFMTISQLETMRK